jgi:hypothetical protein
MNIEKVDIELVKKNPENPRTISDDKLKKLIKSIKDFPEMLEIRPIVVDENMVVLGGNMRLDACKKAGIKEIPIIKWNELDEERKQEFIIKDNVGYGEWDWEILNAEWDMDLLGEWGMDVPSDKRPPESENPYTNKVEAPIYEPSEIKPNLIEGYDMTKYNELVERIEASDLTEEQKEFLRIGATRHIKFDYTKVADIYAHSDKEMQELIEDSALVIIDFEKAIELGYVRISEEIIKKYTDEYGDEE